MKKRMADRNGKQVFKGNLKLIKSSYRGEGNAQF